MKTFFQFFLLLVLVCSGNAASILLRNLPPASAVTADDIFWMVNSPGVSPVDQKLTAANLRYYMTNGLTLNAHGPDKRVQFNKGGVLWSDPGFELDDVEDRLDVPNLRVSSTGAVNYLVVSNFLSLRDATPPAPSTGIVMYSKTSGGLSEVYAKDPASTDRKVMMDHSPYFGHDVYLAARTDGLVGTGTANDPYNGSTAALFDARLQTLVGPNGASNLTLHILPGTYLTRGYGSWDVGDGASNIMIVGAGKGITTLVLTNVANPGNAPCILAYGGVQNFTVADIDIDVGTGTAASGMRTLGVYIYTGTNVVVRNVRVLNSKATAAGEAFGICLEGVQNSLVENCDVLGITTDLGEGSAIASSGQGATVLNNRIDGGAGEWYVGLNIGGYDAVYRGNTTTNVAYAAYRDWTSITNVTVSDNILYGRYAALMLTPYADTCIYDGVLFSDNVVFCTNFSVFLANSAWGNASLKNISIAGNHFKLPSATPGKQQLYIGSGDKVILQDNILASGDLMYRSGSSTNVWAKDNRYPDGSKVLSYDANGPPQSVKTDEMEIKRISVSGATTGITMSSEEPYYSPPLWLQCNGTNFWSITAGDGNPGGRGRFNLRRYVDGVYAQEAFYIGTNGSGVFNGYLWITNGISTRGFTNFSLTASKLIGTGAGVDQQSVDTGTGLLLSGSTLSHNIEAGTNVVLTTNGAALVLNTIGAGGTVSNLNTLTYGQLLVGGGGGGIIATNDWSVDTLRAAQIVVTNGIQSSNVLSGHGMFTNIVTPPVTITQDTTNVVIDFTAGSLQLLTASDDLFFIASNITAGASALVDITAGDTNRNVAFDLGTNWMCQTPTTIPSNHIGWLSILASGTTTNSLRPSYAVSYP